MFTITEAAKAQLLKVLEESEAKAIKVVLKKSGCSGYRYHLDFSPNMDETLIILIDDPVLVVTEAKTLPYLQSVTLDYIQSGLNRTFKFFNPEAKGECGCGESFML